jgi:hypothetical protein
MSLRHEWKRGGMNIDLEDVAKAASICSQSRYDVRNRHKQDIRKACIAKIHEEKRLTPTSLPEEYKHGCTVLAAIKYTKWPPSPNHSYPNRERSSTSTETYLSTLHSRPCPQRGRWRVFRRRLVYKVRACRLTTTSRDEQDGKGWIRRHQISQVQEMT